MKILKQKDWVKDKEEYVRETVFRLTEEDVVAVCEEYYPDMTEDQVKKAVELVEEDYDMYDWMQDMRDYLDNYKDELGI